MKRNEACFNTVENKIQSRSERGLVEQYDEWCGESSFDSLANTTGLSFNFRFYFLSFYVLVFVVLVCGSVC